MATLTYQHRLELPAEAVWRMLADFGAFLDWAGTPGASIEITGAGLGMVRRLNIAGFGSISERLDECDPATRTLGYTLVEGEPLGMVTYSARVTVAAGAGTGTACTLDWQGSFEGRDGADEQQIATQLQGSWQGMSDALGTFVSANT